ncbi:MAG: hypothetical protein ACRDZQ_13485, partial [Acidimicrobiales bacterium]
MTRLPDDDEPQSRADGSPAGGQSGVAGDEGEQAGVAGDEGEQAGAGDVPDDDVAPDAPEGAVARAEEAAEEAAGVAAGPDEVAARAEEVAAWPEPASPEEAAALEAAEEAEEGEAAAGARASETAYIGPDRRPKSTSERDLGDFTTKPAVLRLVPLAAVIGGLSAGISLALLAMIGFITHLLYYQTLDYHLTSPNANT